ncbi:MAG: helix-turn-helix transcriptional regulator [Chloroflexi bacterium]|nr:helix-turn-helix transcriptional regulator [Chloroflexota bacterium]
MGSFGSAIRVVRERAALSQGELAARLGVSQGAISFWEHDVELPTLDHLLELLTEFPELLDALHTYNHGLLVQLRRIERILFAGRCACENCSCKTERLR